MAEGEGGGGGGGFFQQLLTKIGYEVDTEGLNELQESLNKIAERAKLLLGIEIVKGLYELSEKFAGLGESLESSAIAAGLTTEELQKLQFAASQNAVDAGSLNSALFRLGRLLYQAQKGSKGASEAFKKLGIDQAQIKSFNTAEDALLAIQDNIGNLSSQQEKLAVVQQLFGRSGARFLKFLEVGSEETERLKKNAGEMGAVISNEGVKSLAEFEDAASGLKQVLKGFFATVASVFAPSFIGAIHSIEDAWARNRQIVTDGLMAMGKTFAFVMGYVKVTIQNLSKIITALLYNKGGVGEYLTNIAKEIFSTIKTVVQAVMDSLKGVIEDGSLGKFFKDFGALIGSLWDLVKSLFSAFGMLFDKVAEFLGLKTDGISGMTVALRGLLTIADALLVALNGIVKAVTFLFSGGIGDYLGQTFLGGIAGKAMRVDDLKAANPNYNPLLDPNFNMKVPMGPLHQFSTASDAMGKMAMAPASPDFGGALDPGARSVQVTSNVTVNVPPGMTGEQAADLFAQKNKESLSSVLNEAHRDSASAWQY